jgi:5-methylcytosine-specific restriction endonuclease McrA
MSSAVLFLDAEWRPLRIEPWQRAIADLFNGKIEVVEHSRDRMIQGVTRQYPMPSVVRVLKRFKRDKIRIKFSRVNIYARDGFVCQYCGLRFVTEDLSFDHVTPRSRGGRTCWENIVTACIGCNKEKGDKTPEEAKMKLLSKPKKPGFLPQVMVKLDRGNIPPEWKDYWTSTLDT